MQEEAETPFIGDNEEEEEEEEVEAVFLAFDWLFLTVLPFFAPRAAEGCCSGGQEDEPVVRVMTRLTPVDALLIVSFLGDIFFPEAVTFPCSYAILLFALSLLSLSSFSPALRTAMRDLGDRVEVLAVEEAELVPEMKSVETFVARAESMLAFPAAAGEKEEEEEEIVAL